MYFISLGLFITDLLLEEHIATISGMGFTNIESIKKSLKQANNDVNKAVTILAEEIKVGMSIYLGAIEKRLLYFLASLADLTQFKKMPAKVAHHAHACMK